jgi:hypothetical protein
MRKPQVERRASPAPASWLGDIGSNTVSREARDRCREMLNISDQRYVELATVQLKPAWAGDAGAQ